MLPIDSSPADGCGARSRITATFVEVDCTEEQSRMVAVSIIEALQQRDIEIAGFSFDVPLTSLTSPATTAARADAHRDAAPLLPEGVTVAFKLPTERIALASH